MRTTVHLEDDVAAAVAALRESEGVGLSEAVNLLARRGLAAPSPGRAPFQQESSPMGVLIDVSNVAEALELADR